MEIFKSILISFVMWLLVSLILNGLNLVLEGDGFIIRIIKLGTPAFIGAVFYLILAYVLKISLIRDFADKILKRNKKEDA